MSQTATAEIPDVVAEIVDNHPSNTGSLIPVLQDIQERFGYLPESAIDALEARIGISSSEIYGVATFYTQFRFNPPGKHMIQVCQGTACHVRGGLQLLEAFERHLDVKSGETTEDGQFSLERVACLGCCALAPVVAVDGKVFGQVSSKKIKSILKAYVD